jgi:hypothetical protein
MVVEEHEIIECKSWEKVCDYVFEAGSEFAIMCLKLAVKVRCLAESIQSTSNTFQNFSNALEAIKTNTSS